MAEFYIVSSDPGHLVPPVDEIPPEYATVDEAYDAIVSGHHGEYGTRYILKINSQCVAVAQRPWALTRKTEGS